ncbi:MAG: sulfite exporter TauE/SafE family protein [Anaerolineae bacterium]
MLDYLILTFVVVLSVFTQTAAGFGIALVSMPLLTGLLGLSIASPLVTLIAFSTRPVLLLRYRQGFSLREIRGLLLAALAGICTGLLISRRITDETLVERLLGAVVICYSLYSLLNPRVPALKPRWTQYPAGYFSGILAQLYNVGGPPVVMYADSRRWLPATFKGNLQAYGVITSAMVFASRIINGEFTTEVMQYYFSVIPAIILGMGLGFLLDRYLNGLLFRRMVLLLLIATGFTLIV